MIVFTTDPDLAHRVVAAGAAGVVVDWERRGKRRRQAGADTQINADTPDDLAAVRAATGGRLVCRVNGWDPWTPGEIDLAVALGADEILLPIVRRTHEVDAALAHVGGRCRPRHPVEDEGVALAVEPPGHPARRGRWRGGPRETGATSAVYSSSYQSPW